MNAHAKERAADRLAQLSRQGLDLVSFWRAASDVFATAVPGCMSPCWYTMDPASLLVTSHFSEDLPELPPEWLAAEYYDDDVNQLADVARSDRGVSTLFDATGGDPASSPRWHQNMLYGGDQELIAVLRTDRGAVWGAVGLYREAGQTLFGGEDLAFIRSVSPLLAEGARRALLVGQASDPESPDGPGLVVLTERWQVDSTTPGVQRWLADLPDGDWHAGVLPASVLAVAGQALKEAQRSTTAPVVARVLAKSGVWVVLHGATLETDGPRRVAVIVEPAHPARIASLLMSAYGLTEREQDVTRLVLLGNATTEIAAALHVSTHTVQQHLKNVFAKTGVHSRRDLVGKVFFSHYEPRVRDNESRAMDARPLRGEPLVRA